MKEDVISALMEELRKVVPNATKALIDERDQYISKKIHGYVTGSEQEFISFEIKKEKKLSAAELNKLREQSEVKAARLLFGNEQ